ncbi:unnamed protein product [Mytilus edulis]|uniref:Uncharacterized protein n=1 Tax=Mytilus edulis TaxID=6550 RepID=A0A8S3QSK2_MYTED|nr:unnamed protein product [Mytilus edulis]
MRKGLPLTDPQIIASTTEQVALSNIDRNINMNLTGGGGGGGGGIDPGGNGGNLTTNLFINKIKTIHTSDGTIIKVKPGDGRTLEALKLIIDGGGGGGGGGIGKGGDGGSIFTTLTINKLKTVFRNGANSTVAEVQNPLRGLSLEINGGGGGGGGGPGQGGDGGWWCEGGVGPGPGGKGGNLVTNVVIGKLQQKDSRNGSVERANQKEKKIVKDARNGTVERVNHKENKIVKDARKKLMKAMKNQRKKMKWIEKEGKKTRE